MHFLHVICMRIFLSRAASIPRFLQGVIAGFGSRASRSHLVPFFLPRYAHKLYFFTQLGFYAYMLLPDFFQARFLVRSSRSVAPVAFPVRGWAPSIWRARHALPFFLPPSERPDG